MISSLRSPVQHQQCATISNENNHITTSSASNGSSKAISANVSVRESGDPSVPVSAITNTNPLNSSSKLVGRQSNHHVNSNNKRPLSMSCASVTGGTIGVKSAVATIQERMMNTKTRIVQAPPPSSSQKSYQQINQQQSPPPPPALNPQEYIDKLFRERGYSVERFCSLKGGYHCRPTRLQVASHGIKVVEAVRKSDADAMQRFMDMGLSPNPCNNFGESIVHMVCRRGDHRLLEVLTNAGASMQITDDFGRTPLHDACWTPKPFFKIVEAVLKADRRLINITDCRGSLPLAYVNKNHWAEWIEFLESVKDVFWPIRDISRDGDEPKPELVCVKPHTNSVPLPRVSTSLQLVRLISMGKVSLKDAENIPLDEREDYSIDGQRSISIAKPQVGCGAQDISTQAPSRIISTSNDTSNRLSSHGVVNFQPAAL